MHSNTLMHTVFAHAKKRAQFLTHKQFRQLSSTPDGNICSLSPTITNAIKEVANVKRNDFKYIKDNHMKSVLGTYTVGDILSGMKGLNVMVCDTSNVDAQLGISYRGYPIKELAQTLQTANDGTSPLPEALFWLLLTGKLPTASEVEVVRAELQKRAHLPPHVSAAVDCLPTHTHPMTQFITGITAAQTNSVFAKAYAQGVHKTQYWLPALEDAFNLISIVPLIAAHIYKRSFKPKLDIQVDRNTDWASNFTKMLGLRGNEAADMMRLYMFLHADHEAGNVSAHATQLVGSALSDPYLSFAAGMCGLAGPLHGLANQECLNWLLSANEYVNGRPISAQLVEEFTQQTLQSGRVIPGYGHAVLRVTDPRFELQRDFALKTMKDFRLFQLLDVCYKTVPKVLLKTGKVTNPYSNVDCHSGVILTYYGLPETSFYTVLFGVSRAIGVMSQTVWARLYGFPIERPKSITSESLLRLEKQS